MFYQYRYINYFNTTSSDHGNQYRSILSNFMFSCSKITSNSVTLSLRQNTLIINRKIACRINKS